ncbi:MAG: hypothetical protein KatS3mg059_0671 [Thermomicrobiales bacterium]|nr:MAG: hypothetical protein KatS3mg059_0671 [Thermomicrobiales bacterium]
MAQGIHVRADMIAELDAVGGGQPGDTMLGGADALGEFLPGFMHFEGGLHDPGKGLHAIVDWHAEINQPAGHAATPCVVTLTGITGPIAVMTEQRCERH